MELKAGTRLRSTADTTEVIVVRPPSGDVDLRCGGHEMVTQGSASGDPVGVDPAHAEGTQLGKRYSDEESGIELLCTKAGEGSLSIDGRPIGIKDAKALPSSD
jgi:hypothetical protein